MNETGVPVRRPGAVPDDGAHIGAAGVDTDGDALPDTVLTVDGDDLLVQTDLDADGLVDRVLRIGPDGAVRPEPASVERADPAGGTWTRWSELFGPDH